MLRFDVFGREVGVIRGESGWQAVFLGREGKHRPAPGVVIPPHVPARGLAAFLADLFHESARPDRADVVLLNPEALSEAETTRAVFLIGASGVGKTAVARLLEEGETWRERVSYFDDIGVPSAERMARDHGGGEGWQRWATSEWVARLSTRDPPIQLLEGQTRPTFIAEALRAAPRLEGLIILLDCSSEARTYRLAELRRQPGLANERMESWAAYLRGQADALALPVIDTSEMAVSDVARRVEALAWAGLRPRPA